MATTGDQIRQVTELVRKVAEQKRRKQSNAQTMERARMKIRERHEFVPKRVKPARNIRVIL